MKHCNIEQDVTVNSSKNKRKRDRKPWWNAELTTLWSDMSKSEKLWLKCKSRSAKCALKQEYIRQRKNFDKYVQKAKRQYWAKQQTDLMNTCNDRTNFWKTIGKVGVGNERKRNIPMEVVTEDGSVKTDLDSVLNKWKLHFETLFESSNTNSATAADDNTSDPPPPNAQTSDLNSGISILDVREAVLSLNMNKSVGDDGIPAEIMMTDSCIHFLHRLFCVCFETGTIPKAWEYGLITPIHKDTSTDPRDPKHYRGITVTSSVYKAYCAVLNKRLTAWSETVVTDTQCGFRVNRSTIDQIASLTSIVENRKRLKRCTFAAFVDYSRAYDSIPWVPLMQRLSEYGVNGKMYQALKSIYSQVKCAVKVNGHQTDWFSVKCGLKQGCLLSSCMYNCYTTSLSEALNSLNNGIEVNGQYINHLFYADDLVLIAENETDLQIMLDLLSSWNIANQMTINPNKTNIVHFRNNSKVRSDFIFKCGETVITYATTYRYLGLVLHEHLDYSVTAKYVAASATRALGLLISKFKVMGGMPYNVYTQLYETMVWPVISYGAAIWGTKEYSSINAVQNRACRFFLGVGRYTPNAAVNGEMGWLPPIVKQWKSVMGHWFRLSNMDTSRINHKVFMWSYNMRNRCKNWCFNIEKTLRSHNIDILQCFNYHSRNQRKQFISGLVDKLMNVFTVKWTKAINKDNSGLPTKGGNKLRTYKLFKNVYETERYTTIPTLSRARRSSLAKFRCGVAPLRLETGRYEGIDISERRCFRCALEIENEEHTLILCPEYEHIRSDLFNKISMSVTDFYSLSPSDKLCHVLSNNDCIIYSAKACHDILLHRRNCLYE